MSSNPSESTAPAVTPSIDVAAELKQRFPALFGGAFKPLKLHIQADIQQRAPGVFSKQALSAFFRRHTGATGYLVAMSKATHRFDLDGNPSGELSDEHKQAAAQELARRRGLHQAKVEQAEDGRRKRAALLRDFENTTLTPANFCALKGIAPTALDALLETARKEARERPPPQRPQRPAQRPPRHDARPKRAGP
jgi:ProP effector